MVRFRAGAPTDTVASAPSDRTEGPPLPEVSATTSGEDAPRRCAVCSHSLTVAERMFYFLEGVGATPICRACSAHQRPEMAAESELLSTSGSVRFAGAPAPEPIGVDPKADPTRLTDSARALVIEELDRVRGAIERIPSGNADRPLVERLEGDVRDAFTAGRLSEALEALRDLRRVLSAVTNGHARTPITAPWDESVEELFDRVIARSREMARRPLAPPEEREAIESLAPSGALRRTGVSPYR